MKYIIPNVIILLSAATIVAAQDTVVFKNGDVLTGEILKQTTERIYLKTSAFGSVSLDTSDISEVRIINPELGEIVVAGDTPAAPDPEWAEAEPDSPEPAQQQPVPEDKPEEKSKWSGQAGLAIAMRESNTLQRSGDNLYERDQSLESYRVYGNVNWDGLENSLLWDMTYRYSQTDLRTEDDYFNVTQNYQHNFTDIYYTSCKTIYQYDYRRGIDGEFLQTAEAGIQWLDRETLKLSTSVGGGYHQYDRIQTQYSAAEGKFILDQSLSWQMINSLTLFQKYSHLGNLEQYHFLFTSGLENKLIRDIFLRLEYRLERDTEVNYYDTSYYDKALLTSLLYKF